MTIEFFSAVDKTKDGKISSEMPSWFFNVHLEIAEEDVAKKKRAIARGEIPQESIFMVQNEIKKEEDKILEIKKSKPVLRGGQKDQVYQEYVKIGKEIAENMPTRRDELNGFANAREELEKNNTPCIPMSPEMAHAAGFELKGGKVTRKQAQKFYKMAGSLLGENTNIERIRREGKSESYRTMENLTQRILEKVAG